MPIGVRAWTRAPREGAFEDDVLLATIAPQPPASFWAKDAGLR
jgi:hypothetical protein